ncbi:hypothetical protein Nepgr_010318 [Nepenthes gracilis]|uniref:Uncharacterized protein n=1 Tax=Nepenthes gracilis TaxID=150966 RepID=A0AAD3SC07_NEPGR|nr:hypothetical protein Nepgr_010318 [Nepenthes gracilis]
MHFALYAELGATTGLAAVCIFPDMGRMDDWQADKVGLVLRNGYGRFGRIGRYESLDWMPGLHRISNLHLFEDLANLTGLSSFLE